MPDLPPPWEAQPDVFSPPDHCEQDQPVRECPNAEHVDTRPFEDGTAETRYFKCETCNAEAHCRVELEERDSSSVQFERQVRMSDF